MAIFVLGSINLDFAAHTRMPKKGETVLAEQFLVSGGGKGANQAAAIARLGGAAAMIGAVGSDVFGVQLVEGLQKAGVDTSYVTQKEGASGLAMIWVSGGDNRIVVDAGANALVDSLDVDVALAAAREGDILVAQLEVPQTVVAYAFAQAKKIGMKTILNPAPAAALDPILVAHTDVIVPNESETERLTGIAPCDTVHTVLAVKRLYEMGAGAVVVTMGARGSAVAVGQTVTELAARKVRVVDTTAAGDTFVGALALKLDCGADLVEACEFATVAASITVQRKGALCSIPSLDEVFAVLAKAE